jgi:flavin-binding protein dodecin
MSEQIYSFDTASLHVVAYAEPEEMDPADSFEFDEDIEAVRNGDVEWFSVKVEVKHNYTGALLGFSSLGGCAYKSVDEFTTGHRNPDPMSRNCSVMRDKQGGNVSTCHYFPDMIREACDEARANLRKLRNLPVRENA